MTDKNSERMSTGKVFERALTNEELVRELSDMKKVSTTSCTMWWDQFSFKEKCTKCNGTGQWQLPPGCMQPFVQKSCEECLGKGFLNSERLINKV